MFGHALQLGVDAQVEVVAGYRQAALVGQVAQPPAGGIGLDHLVARHAAQLVLVAALDAGLADLRQPLVLVLFQAGVVGVGNAADVADQVRGHVPHRIVAGQLRLHIHTDVFVAAHLVARHLLHRQVRTQRHRVVALHLVHALLEARDIAVA